MVFLFRALYIYTIFFFFCVHYFLLICFVLISNYSSSLPCKFFWLPLYSMINFLRKRNILDILIKTHIGLTRLGSRSFHYSTRIMNSIKDLSENVWQPQDALPKHIKVPVNYMFAFLQIIRSLKFQKELVGWIMVYLLRQLRV